MVAPKPRNGTGVQNKAGKRTQDELEQAMNLLAGTEVLVGFPEDTTERPDDEVTNAVLGYVHDNGAPEENIPARPFMIPGIENAQERVTEILEKTGRAVMRGGGADAVEAGLTRAGFAAKVSIQQQINSNIPPPLAESTLKARRRRGRKGAADELNAREYGMELVGYGAGAKTLVDTAEMLKAVNYVIRPRANRK